MVAEYSSMRREHYLSCNSHQFLVFVLVDSRLSFITHIEDLTMNSPNTSAIVALMDTHF